MFLAFTDGDVWRPGIGDPTVMGWVTVAAYFIAGIICLKVGLNSKGDRTERRFWGLLCLAMIFLCFNKQLDLQTWFTITLRGMSRSQGWYEYRRPLQMFFILFVVVAGLVACFSMYSMVRKEFRENRMALLGIAFVICFVIVRAASFHHVDIFLKHDIGGVRMNWILELTGIGLIAANGISRLRRPRALPGGIEGPGFVVASKGKGF